MKTHIRISEYDFLSIGNENSNQNKTLDKNTFEALERFILCNKKENSDALELMGISARRGVGKIITAKNYVGVISLHDGTTIEILPKIYSPNEDQGTVKALFIKMLHTLNDSPYKSFQNANIDIAKMDILEMFIRIFINEVISLVKTGLRCGYETLEENALFFKGKMDFSKHIKSNLIHKERNYIIYDEFIANRPENRVLKSTLLYLYKQTSSTKNKSDIKNLLTVFENVDPSISYENDFSKFVEDRNMRDYETALTWSRIFLQGKSFTSFSGSEIATALLFPMEKLFENYVARLFKKYLSARGFRVLIQDKKYHLFEEPKRCFSLRPDIVIESPQKEIYIIDTKWKNLYKDSNNLGISQSDMYQMYVYQKKYTAKSVTLLYPQNKNFQCTDCFSYCSKNDFEDVNVHVKFIDLLENETKLAQFIDSIVV